MYSLIKCITCRKLRIEFLTVCDHHRDDMLFKKRKISAFIILKKKKKNKMDEIEALDNKTVGYLTEIINPVLDELKIKKPFRTNSVNLRFRPNLIK